MLTITGKAFGSENAVVFVGSDYCYDVVHTVSGTEVTCTLPPGSQLASRVVIIPSGMSPSDPTNTSYLSYEQCVAGTFQDDVAIDCVNCPPGSYTDVIGQLACSECKSILCSILTHLSSH